MCFRLCSRSFGKALSCSRMTRPCTQIQPHKDMVWKVLTSNLLSTCGIVWNNHNEPVLLTQNQYLAYLAENAQYKSWCSFGWNPSRRVEAVIAAEWEGVREPYIMFHDFVIGYPTSSYRCDSQIFASYSRCNVYLPTHWNSTVVNDVATPAPYCLFFKSWKCCPHTCATIVVHFIKRPAPSLLCLLWDAWNFNQGEIVWK